ncbi:hypothetical protein GQR58_028563 [Nymphon striatum]|nr:hypothetical protein GQR58_028563 [Nymphon striatum]
MPIVSRPAKAKGCREVFSSLGTTIVKGPGQNASANFVEISSNAPNFLAISSRWRIHMYRAPVAEISHTLKQVADMKSALESGKLGDLSEDLVDAVLEEAWKIRQRAYCASKSRRRFNRCQACAIHFG